MINISKPIIDYQTIKEVIKVLKSGIIVQGSKTAELEKNLAKLNRKKYAVVFNSGTAALHTALSSMGIKEKDEVITTPFSFIASANSILMCGAIPVFVDIQEESFNIDPSKIEEKISNKTKAILAVDLYGQPCDYDRIVKITKKYNLKIISDSCQSLGATYNSQPIGQHTDITCFSLYATKNIIMGEGGALVTNDKKIYDYAKRFRQHGQDMEIPYVYHHLGYNYRATDIASAIGLNQLKKLKLFTKKRQQNAKRLSTGLKNIKGLILPEILDKRTHVFHQYTVRVTPEFPISRDELKKYLFSKGINSGIYYPTLIPSNQHIITPRKYHRGDFPVAEKIAQEVLSIPVHPGLSPKNISNIIQAIKEVSQ